MKGPGVTGTNVQRCNAEKKERQGEGGEGRKEDGKEN